MASAPTFVQKHKLGKYISIPEVRGESDLEKDLQSIERSLDFGIESVARKELLTARLQSVFPTVDPSFLNMRSREVYSLEYGGYSFACNVDLLLPRFAVYSLDSPHCEIEISLKYKNREYRDTELWMESVEMTHPELPLLLENPLKEAIRLGEWDSFCGDRAHCDTWEFTSVFQGIIPKETKERIKQSQKAFGKDIYIIAEAKDWIGQEIPIEDPLVVGVIDDTCFLLDEFDCTTMEAYVAREFSEGERKRK